MTGSPPSGTDIRTLARELMDIFTEGWSKADVTLVLSVFADEAVFHETPFSSPCAGREEIRRYWTDVPFNQSDITATSGEIFTVGPWFATEFKAVFRRRRTGEWVEAKGAIFCETDGSKVTEMRMYWHRK